MSSYSYSTSIAGVGAPYSPDATPAVSLSLYDQDAAGIYQNALVLAQSLFPDWNPLAGNTETDLIEVFSSVAAELIFAINRLPEAIVESLIGQVGIPRSPGNQASASATFTAVDTLGHTVPGGSLVQLALSQQGGLFNFTTDADCIIPTGASVGTVGITCTSYSATPNLTPPGTPLTALGGFGAWVDTVALATGVTGGMDPESVEAWVQRSTQRFQRLSAAIVTPKQFLDAALETPTVWRCRVTNNWDPTANSGNGASATGYVTLSVFGQGGASCSTSVKTGLQASLQAMAQANLGVYVVDPTITSIDVVVNCQRLPGFTDGQVSAFVTAALAGYLSTDTWMWDDTVHLSKVTQVVEDAGGVDFVTTITLNGAVGDVALTGIANLAEVGTVTVNVTDPAATTSTTTTVNVAATVFQSGSTDATVQSAVASAVTSYLNTAIAAGLVRYSTLIAKIAAVANVTDVQNVTINGSANDLSVSPSATTAGAVTITMGN